MAFVLNDRVKETTTTTGTGTINLGGAATGFETFVAGIGNSNVTYYCIAGQGTAEFEVGIGTVTDASPDTLSRTTILSSSNSDSAVNFSAGTKDVFCTLPASKTIRELDTALNVPTGTTAQRASSPAAGDLRFNTTSSKFEGYSGSAWGNVGVEGNFLVTNIFAGDGSDTTFTISNAVADENNLLVFIDGVFQAHDSYSVSGTTVTFSTAPANGRVITIYSALNNVQGSNMVLATMTGDNSDTTLALGVTPTSENAVQVYIDGTYQNKDTYSISGQTLTFSTAPPTGTAVEAITHTITDISAAASNILVDEFTGDGSDTTFTLSAAPTNENNTQVFVGGVYQEKATYSISNAVLTFTAAPANGVSIEVVSIAVGQINSAVQLADADGDTKVMVEESSDEDKIRFDTGGSQRMVIDDSGHIGIGTDSPTTFSGFQTLHLKNGSGDALMLIESDGGVISQDIVSDSVGLVTVGARSNHSYRVTTNDAERLRVTTDGDLLVRQTSADVYDTNTGGTVRQFWGNQFSAQNNTASRVIIGSGSNAGLVGGATLNSGGTRPIVNSYISFGSTNQTAGSEAGMVQFYTSTGGATGAVRARIDSDGLKFGSDTAAANALDDYEEGTWNPTDASGAGLTFNNIDRNRYTKIGRFVMAHVRLDYPTTSDGSTATIALPFTPSNDCTASTTGGVMTEQNYSTGVTLTASIDSTTGARIRTNGYPALTNANLSGKSLRFTVTFITA